MNVDPEEFETLRQLMALKRHEQPPPGYLNRLNDRIINRIERGEGQLNFWDRLSARLTLRPGLAYAFGLTVCGALGLSAVYMVRQEMARKSDSTAGVVLSVPEVAYSTQAKPVAQIRVTNWLGNTNPTFEMRPEYFYSSLNATPVSYKSGN